MAVTSGSDQHEAPGAEPSPPAVVAAEQPHGPRPNPLLPQPQSEPPPQRHSGPISLLEPTRATPPAREAALPPALERIQQSLRERRSGRGLPPGSLSVAAARPSAAEPRQGAAAHQGQRNTAATDPRETEQVCSSTAPQTAADASNLLESAAAERKQPSKARRQQLAEPPQMPPEGPLQPVAAPADSETSLQERAEQRQMQEQLLQRLETGQIHPDEMAGFRSRNQDSRVEQELMWIQFAIELLETHRHRLVDHLRQRRESP